MYSGALYTKIACSRNMIVIMMIVRAVHSVDTRDVHWSLVLGFYLWYYTAVLSEPTICPSLPYFLL